MKGYIPANKYGTERINRSQDPVKEPNELTPKLDGNGILLPHQVPHHHGGDQLVNGGRNRAGMNSLKKKSVKLQRFRYRQWRFPVTDGRCRAHTAQNACSTLLHMSIFSSRGPSSSQGSGWVL